MIIIKEVRSVEIDSAVLQSPGFVRGAWEPQVACISSAPLVPQCKFPL